MAWLFGWIHALAFKLALLVARLLGQSLWYTVGAFLALLGEEVRRYLGLALWGAVIWLAGTATMNYAPQQARTPLVLTILGLTVIWGLALLRGIRLTMANNLYRQRQRKYFRELRGEVGQLGKTIRGDLGRRAYGTPMGGLWKDNRERRDREQARAEAEAARAERERAEQAAWEEAVAAKRAEREQYAAAAASRWADRDNQQGG